MDYEVGARGFEPPLSRPPDVRFNRTKLYPETLKKLIIDNITQS